MQGMLKRALLAMLVLIAAAAAAWGAFVFYPKSYPPPEMFQEPELTIDETMGLFADGDGNNWLVLPGMEAGLTRYAVSAWESPSRRLTEQAAYQGLTRVPDQPYQVEAVGIEAGNVSLAGWLFRPTDTIRAGIVILHGSGTSDRRNAYYVYLAHRLALAGYAVILPDKRGSGRSEGDWRDTALNQLAQDGADWFAILRERFPNLPHEGVVGVSQGGIIAPQTAHLADADFAVSLSGSAVSLREALRHEIGNDVRESGAPDFLHNLLTSAFSLRAARRHPEFWRKNGEYSMLSHWLDWKGAWFIAYGQDDEADNVPVALSEELILQVVSDGNPSVHVYSGTGHSLTDETSMFVPEFEKDLHAWLLLHSASGND